jgi:hypothetical protein
MKDSSGKYAFEESFIEIISKICRRDFPKNKKVPFGIPFYGFLFLIISPE